MDIYIVCFFETALLVLFMYSLVERAATSVRHRNRKKEVPGNRIGVVLSAKATVTRSEQSMNSLYAMYGVATVVATITVDVANGFDGYKAGIIFMNYLILTYLYFYSSWFRNSVFFPEIEKIRND